MDLPQAHRLVELATAVHAARWDAEPSEAHMALSARIDDISVAARTLLAGGQLDLAASLVGSLSSFWQSQGRVEQGRAVTNEVLVAAAGDTDRAVWAGAHLVAGELAFRAGDQAEATEATSRARDLAAAAGDTWLEAEAETNLARIAFRDGDADRIHRHATRVDDLADGRPRLQVKARHMLGWAAYTAGDTDAAMEHFRVNAVLYRGLDDRLGEAGELANVADLAMESGDDETAATCLARALDTPGMVEDRYLLPGMLRTAGVLAARRGDARTAVELAASADQLYAEAGLEPDPGDEATEDTLRSARSGLGTDLAFAAEARGRGRSPAECLQLALEVALGGRPRS